MSQGRVCCEAFGKRRSTSVANSVTTQIQGMQGGVCSEALGKQRRSTSVANSVTTQRPLEREEAPASPI